MPLPRHHNHPATHCCCCNCNPNPNSNFNSCCSPSSPFPPPPATTSDQLLQLLAGHLLLQQQPHHPHPHQPLKPHPTKDQTHQQSLLHSLLRRVAALESSLPHLSSPPPPPPPPPPSPPSPPLSLRDLAARTIQLAFRRFLLRRSQTLRHLKHLAAIKSDAAALKSTRSDPKALSQRAMDLLLELDSIQSGDPMIREGRRSMSRELGRILEFADKVLAREQQLSLGAMEIVARGRAQPTRSARRVSFAEIGEESRVVLPAAYDPSREESNDLDAASDRRVLTQLMRELKLKGNGSFARVFEEDGEVDHSGGEKSPQGFAEAGFRYGENGIAGLSAPLPMQFEPRRG